jgi:hypothetical protein
VNYFLGAVAIALIALLSFVDAIPELNRLFMPISDDPDYTASVSIEDTVYFFDPALVETIRPDLFQPGAFSMLDVLVHLDQQGAIRLTYHFDPTLNTYLIDAINGEPDWWYYAYYSGGWRETNVFRPDHYPWKNGTTLAFFREDLDQLNEIYQTWADEITRRATNNGIIVIPEIMIRGFDFSVTFYDIVVTPHNLRNDVLQTDVITAIDVIMTLGDQGNITYDLMFYDSIGSADIVRSYWVESINNNTSFGGCGFVYEAGSQTFPFFSGNHIHLPSDVRIINSPEYVEFFWICL